MHYVYIIECKDGKLYTGITENIERRLKEHQRHGSHFTSYNPAVKLLYKEPFPDKHQAAKREKQIKGWTLIKKMALVNGDFAALKKYSKRGFRVSERSESNRFMVSEAAKGC